MMLVLLPAALVHYYIKVFVHADVIDEEVQILNLNF
jgi:hypothetical protein